VNKCCKRENPCKRKTDRAGDLNKPTYHGPPGSRGLLTLLPACTGQENTEELQVLTGQHFSSCITALFCLLLYEIYHVLTG
jgi:hypothetical protein